MIPPSIVGTKSYVDLARENAHSQQYCNPKTGDGKQETLVGSVMRSESSKDTAITSSGDVSQSDAKTEDTSAGLLLVERDPARAVIKSLQRQVFNGVSFASGLAWKDATIEIVQKNEPFGEASKAVSQWLIALVSAIILLPLITLLLWLQKRCVRSSKGEVSTSKRLWGRAVARSCKAIIDWGLVFVLASQIDNAAAASIPSTPKYWSIVYFVLLLTFSCGVPAVIVHLLGGESKFVHADAHPDPDKVIRVGIADACLSGSVYVVALSFLSTTETLLDLHAVSTSEDVGMLSMLALFMVMLALAILRLLQVTTRLDATTSAVLKAAELQADAPGIVRRLSRNSRNSDMSEDSSVCTSWCRNVNLVGRLYVGKVALMSAVVVLYTFLYVCLASAVTSGDASVHDPLPIWAAVVVLLLSLFFAICAGLTLRILIKHLFAWLFEQVDNTTAPTDGDLADSPLATLLLMVVAAYKAVMDSMLWMIGCGIHGLLFSIVSDPIARSNAAIRVLVLCSYALAVSLAAVIFAFMFPPPAPEDVETVRDAALERYKRDSQRLEKAWRDRGTE